MSSRRKLLPYRYSLAGSILTARERVMSPIRPILRAAGITEQQWRVLRVLVDQGSLDPSSLAECALLHAPSVTRILRDLVERQFVERCIDPTDGRRSIIAITDAGRDLFENTAVETLKLLETYANTFGEDRIRNLIDELQALSEALAPLGGETGDPE